MGTHHQDKVADTCRSQFDKVRSTRLHSVPPASPSDKENIPPIDPQVNFAIYAPTKPKALEHIGELLKSDFKVEWKKSLWEGYDKNAKVGTFTTTFPIQDVPKNEKSFELPSYLQSQNHE